MGIHLLTSQPFARKFTSDIYVVGVAVCPSHLKQKPILGG